jgi:hypothetical protein
LYHPEVAVSSCGQFSTPDLNVNYVMIPILDHFEKFRQKIGDYLENDVTFFLAKIVLF